MLHEGVGHGLIAWLRGLRSSGAFLPDYTNWKGITSTDRIDTKTLRLILGNDIAVKAIEDNKINSWPDGDGNTSLSYSRQTNRHRRTIVEL